MRVIIVEPGQYPRAADIEQSLAAEQAVVGGLIDVAYPWPDRACLVCHDEGKLIPLPMNRYLPEMDDIVFGTFFICGDAGETFCDLGDRQAQQYMRRFKAPELFLRTSADIVIQRCTPEQYLKHMEGRQTRARGKEHEPIQ